MECKCSKKNKNGPPGQNVFLKQILSTDRPSMIRVTIVGITRMILLHLVFTDTESFDYWNSWGPALGQCEIDLAIIAACIPTLKPIVAAWLPSIFTSEPAYHESSENCFATTTFGGTKASGSRSGHAGVVPNVFVLSSMGRTRTTIRGHSPDESEEEEIMTSNGIMRRTRVDVVYTNTTPYANHNSRTLSG